MYIYTCTCEHKMRVHAQREARGTFYSLIICLHVLSLLQCTCTLPERSGNTPLKYMYIILYNYSVLISMYVHYTLTHIATQTTQCHGLMSVMVNMYKNT